MEHATLCIISTILKVLGWIVVVAGVISTVILAVAAPSGIGALVNVIEGLLITAVGAVIIFALAYLIPLLIDIESNTRQTRESLDKEE